MLKHKERGHFVRPTVLARHDDVRNTIHENGSLSVPYIVMNALSAVVATYGMLENSTAVIIGAMIIALLLGPITGLALAVCDGDKALLGQAMLAETCGVALVLAVSYSLGLIHHDTTLGSQVISRTSPNIMDLMIALGGGAAGAYATVSPRLSAGLVGVAIATALVPPLCACGLCLAHHLYRPAGGAFLLFFTNFVAIQAVSAVVFWIAGYVRAGAKSHEGVLARFAPSVAVLAALAFVLGRSFEQALATEVLHADAQKVLGADFTRHGATLADITTGSDGKNRTLLTAVVRAPWVVTPQSCARLQGVLRRDAKRSNVDLHIRTVLTRECDAKQYLYDTSDASQSLKSGGD